MNVLVTGANGFVGAAVCRLLLQKGHSVTGLVRRTSDLSLLQGLSVQTEYGSLGDNESLMRAAGGKDIVFHIAAKVSDWGSLDDFRQINVEGTRKLLDAAAGAGVQKFVYVSSVAVHSFTGAVQMNEESPQLPTSYPYCQSKREAEALVLDYHNSRKISAVIIRPGDVYGPGDRTSLLKMKNMLVKGLMGLICRGRKLGAFTYVENLAHGIVLAGMSDKSAGRAYIITDGVQMTWREYFNRLTKEIGVPRPRFSLPGFLAWPAAYLFESVYRLFNIKTRPPLTKYLVDHLTHDFCFSTDRARDELEYMPVVQTEEAIRRTARWFIDVAMQDH